MSAGNELSMMSCTCRESTSLLACGQVTSQWWISRRLFRPWALAFIGLAISVALWGFGYKLSRYNPHQDAASRALFAKMWDKHQDVAQVAATTKATAQQHLQLELHAVLLIHRQPPTGIERAFFYPDTYKRIPALFCSVVPLRSPPFRVLAA